MRRCEWSRKRIVRTACWNIRWIQCHENTPYILMRFSIHVRSRLTFHVANFQYHLNTFPSCIPWYKIHTGNSWRPEKEMGPSRDQFSINRNRIHTNISLRERENNFRNPYVCPELLYFVNAFEMKKNSGDSRPPGAPTPWNWKPENMFWCFLSETLKWVSSMS